VTPAEGGLEVRHVWLQDFRNYASAEIALSPGLTVVTGSNGQGKTNLLEALAYASTASSFRRATAESLVRKGAEAAIVRVEGERAGRPFLIEAEIRAAGRTRLQVNHQRARRAADLAEVLTVSVFSPDDLVVIKGGPAERRRYLDDTVVACRPMRDAVRADLERVLRQKSALLRQAHGTVTDDVRATLDVWNERLVALGEALADARTEVLQALEPLVAEAYHQIAPAASEVPVRLVYESSWRAMGLAEALAAATRDEVRRGACLVGPHRDDVGIELDGMPSRAQASQGEQRTLALALRLAAHRLVAAERGVRPVLLLDDLFSELDPQRSAALIEHLPEGQALLTTAGPVPDGARPGRTLTVVAGRITEPAPARADR
jgi:DNA replication and repair protein RecF